MMRLWLMLFFSLGSMCINTVNGFDDELVCDDLNKAKKYDLSDCDFVTKYCEDDFYVSTYYCSTDAGKVFFIFACLIWLGLLFVLLGSTADDYFSPALEQFSTKLGLPPRFAGVTLLALGNGAPDVSSTIASINSGEDGYLLSLGALTGAGMFVGTVVAGSVMMVDGGVPCRGALIRDVVTYLATCCLVLAFFSSGQISMNNVITLLCCYFTFISVVLAADIYHRMVVLPRLKASAPLPVSEEDGFEMNSAINMLEAMVNDHNAKSSNSSEAAGRSVSPLSDRPSPISSPGSGNSPGSGSGSGSRSGNSRSKKDITGVTNHRAQYIIMHADSEDFDINLDEVSTDESGYVALDENFSKSSNKILKKKPKGSQQDVFTDLPAFSDKNSMKIVKEEEEEELNLKDRLISEMEEGYDEFKEMTLFSKGLYVLELPFMLARRLSVPITAEDNYVKPYLLMSVALMPLWFFGYYLSLYDYMLGATTIEDDDDDLPSDDYYSAIAPFSSSATRRQLSKTSSSGGFPLLVIILAVSFSCAFGLNYLCSDNKPPHAVLSTVLALTGFAVAASWIDTIADQLVSTLSFFGSLLSIPQPVLGLTVLAWGNSIGDYSTNMAMAKKGLSNMAMTACFAGPVFNMLIGIGVGFLRLLNSNNDDVRNGSYPVELSSGIIAGFSFLLLNCSCIAGFGIFNKNFVPKEYGMVSVGMYLLYLIVSFILLFGNF